MRIGMTLGGEGSLRSQVQQVVDAERDGFDSFWVNQIFGFDALTVITLAAETTKRIELGTAVLRTYSRHPFLMAQQALTIQAVADGRFTLGIGPSHKEVIEYMWGLPYEQNALHVREYLTVLRALVNERSVNFSGEKFRVAGGLQMPEVKPCPILIAALAPMMLRIAGELADGTVTWMAGPKTIETHIVPRINAAAEAAGRSTPRVAVGLPVAVEDDIARARQTAATMFQIYGQLPNYRRVLDREGVAGPGDVAIVGSETAVERQLRSLAEAGATDFVAGAFSVGDDAAASLGRTRALLRELIGKL